MTKKFIQGDCLEVLPKLGAFNLIITDPPYNIGWEYSKQINDNRKDYHEWCLEWAMQCLRRNLQTNGRMAIINYPENNNILYTKLIEKGYYFHEQLIWEYPTNIGHSNTKYTRNYRTIIIFSNYGQRGTFNPIKQPYKNPTDKRIAKKIAEGSEGTNHYATFEYNLCKNVSKDKKNNGINQLPKELVEMLIKTYSKEGDSVLDPFVGNGTVMDIAHELNRNAVGIDINSYNRSIKS